MFRYCSHWREYAPQPPAAMELYGPAEIQGDVSGLDEAQLTRLRARLTRAFDKGEKKTRTVTKTRKYTRTFTVPVTKYRSVSRTFEYHALRRSVDHRGALSTAGVLLRARRLIPGWRRVSKAGVFHLT